MAAKKKARKKSKQKKAATPATKASPAMDFIVAALKKDKGAVYGDIKAAADKKNLTVYPIMYGRAKLLLGLVKAGAGVTKKKAAKRGPGRPKGSKNKRGPGRPKGSKNKRGPGRPRKVGRRSPGRPRKASSDPLVAVRELLGAVKAAERENDQLRDILGKIGELLKNAI